MGKDFLIIIARFLGWDQGKALEVHMHILLGVLMGGGFVVMVICGISICITLIFSSSDGYVPGGAFPFYGSEPPMRTDLKWILRLLTVGIVLLAFGAAGFALT